MFTLETFYKSKQWEAFRRTLIAERTDSNGFVRCAVCGEPITAKYDLIVHHIQELTQANVNDAVIAFNPDNCVCVHFKCHNKEHERWQGGYKPVRKKVYVVYGAPLSGKSTWVHDAAGYNDLIIDVDSIWECITGKPRYVKPDKLAGVMYQVRDKMLEIVRYRAGKWHNAFIITGGAVAADRRYIFESVNANEYKFIDTPKEICLERLRYRDFSACKPWESPDKLRKDWERYITEWFEQYSG